jgi:two-component system KDP operon response regulator KdpE
MLVLDLGLPDGDGIDLIRDLRAWSQAPVIVLSARSR